MPDPLHVGVGPTWRATYRAVKSGLVPAEVLPQTLRHRLLRELLAEGLSVVEIAELTMTTCYTTSRILNMKEPPS